MIYCITQFGTIGTIGTIVLSGESSCCHAADDERLDSFETCRADKKICGIKINYKNCASRWSLTHFSNYVTF